VVRTTASRVAVRSPTESRRGLFLDVARLLLVGFAYWGSARLSLRLSLVGESVTPIWPPTGIALVGFLLFGYRIWPAVATAAFLVNLPISPSASAAAGIAAGNALAPIAACFLLRASKFRLEIDRTRDALSLVFLAALASMTISATAGSLSLRESGAIRPDAFWSTWSVWWTGDAMGVLAVAPFLLSVMFLRPGRRIAWGRAAEAVLLFAAVAGACVLLQATERPVWVAVFPLLGWAAWRFQQRGSAPAALGVIAVASWAAARDLGPFAEPDLLKKMLGLQVFNAAVAFTSFFFAALVAERKAAQRALELSAQELEEKVRDRTAELTASKERLEVEISERRQAQHALEQREAQLSEAQAVAHLGSWEWDVAANRVSWSEELHRIFGVPPESFGATYEAYLERIHPDDRDSVNEWVRAAMADRSPFEFEHRILRPDGIERVVQSRGRVVADASGNPVRMLGTAQDITEQWRAQRALREREEFFRTVFESAVIGMAQTDPEGRLALTNAAFEGLLGYAPGELTDRPLQEIVHSTDRARFEDLFERMIQGEIGAFEVEIRLRRSSGGKVWVHASMSVVRDEHGQPRFVHALAHDLSERKRAESLQRAEGERARLSSLFARVPAAVAVTRGPEHIIEFANDAFGALVRGRECIGLPASQAFPDGEERTYLERLDATYGTGEPVAVDEAVVRLGGAEDAEPSYFNFVFQPLREPDGEVEGVLVHGIDVTDAVRARLQITESLAFLDTLLALAPAGFAVFDHAGRYIHINERQAQMNGLPVEAHLGRKISDILPQASREVEPILERVMRSREPVVDVEIRSERRDGETRDWLASYYPVLTPAGEILGVGSVSVEITEHKRYERLLSGQKEVLELVARGNDPRAGLEALARLAEEQSSGDVRAAIMLLDDEGILLRHGAAPSIPPAYCEAIDGTPAGPAAGSCGVTATTGEPVVVTDIASHPSWASLRHRALAYGLRAAWSSPIRAADGAVLGVFCMYCTKTRGPTPQEQQLMDVLTQTAAIALERERYEMERRRIVDRERDIQTSLYEREHRIAETLQRSLLPDELPVTPDVAVAARYIPAAGDLEIGGDWYDIIPIPDGRLGLAIGDVAGHGVPAAAAMGQMRMALRAYALEGLSPAHALERLNVLLNELQPGAMATLLYAHIDLDAGALTLAKAGHPPPLLLAPPAKAEYIGGALAPPLGVSALTTYEERSLELPSGSTVILYTDGLIERRGIPLDRGMELLARVAGEAPDDLDAACDHIVDSLLSGNGTADDTALLAVRRLALTGRPLHLRLRAQPTTLTLMRRVVGRWLRQNGFDDDEIQEVLIACTEACTNAMQHAYGTKEGWMELDGSISGADMALAIRDFGTWKAPGPAQEDRGRGLRLMQGLMDGVDVVSGVDGTVVRMKRRAKAARDG
jgi:PAS domain S-box-containing protein